MWVAEQHRKSACCRGCSADCTYNERKDAGCRASDMSTQPSSAVLLDGVKLPNEEPPAAAPVVTYKDLFLRFALLGWIAFGGPTAHIALFQKVQACSPGGPLPKHASWHALATSLWVSVVCCREGPQLSWPSAAGSTLCAQACLPSLAAS